MKNGVPYSASRSSAASDGGYIKLLCRSASLPILQPSFVCRPVSTCGFSHTRFLKMSLLSSLKLSIPVLLGILAPKVSAVTSISDGQMTSFLNTGALDLARMYGPVWFFGQSQNQVPCYPTWAFGGSPTTNDTYDALHKTAAAPQCQYPNVGCSCRNPGVPIGNQGPAFPIYYTYQRCNDTEVRVAYNLFYQKDGAQFGTIATGHD